MSLDDQIQQLLQGEALRQQSFSGLGFFSKPVRAQVEGRDYVVKVYRKIRSQEKAEALTHQHDQYVARLLDVGLLLPTTHIHLHARGNGWIPVVVQDAFRDEELLRNRMELAPVEEYLIYLAAMMEEVQKYARYVAQHDEPLGFHPTSRNFAWQANRLWFFDTFPPMAMPQQALNRMIVEMAPVKVSLGGVVPLRLINRVSDEYYQLAPMILGIVGSACRLRPALSDAVLAWSREFAQHSLSGSLQQTILAGTQQPPRLSRLWTGIRGLLGKEGKPNVT